MGSGSYNLVSLEVNDWLNQSLDQDQDLGFPLGKGQGKNYIYMTITVETLIRSQAGIRQNTRLQL